MTRIYLVTRAKRRCSWSTSYLSRVYVTYDVGQLHPTSRWQMKMVMTRKWLISTSTSWMRFRGPVLYRWLGKPGLDTKPALEGHRASSACNWQYVYIFWWTHLHQSGVYQMTRFSRSMCIIATLTQHLAAFIYRIVWKHYHRQPSLTRCKWSSFSILAFGLSLVQRKHKLCS